MTRVAKDAGNPPGKPRAVVRVADVEGLIASLPGVVSARLVVNDWGGVEEIHVLATTERSAKQIVRDVESSLQARWGLRVDHRKISVAQVVATETALPPMRPRLVGVAITHDVARARIRAVVTLGLPSDDDARIEGRAEGPNLPGHQVRVVAQATLDALNAAMRTDSRLNLEDVRVVTLGAYEVAVVVVTVDGAGIEQRVLTGSAVLEGDPVDAVVKACLHATNRFMERNIVRKTAPSPEAEAGPTEVPATVHGLTGEAAGA